MSAINQCFLIVCDVTSRVLDQLFHFLVFVRDASLFCVIIYFDIFYLPAVIMGMVIIIINNNIIIMAVVIIIIIIIII